MEYSKEMKKTNFRRAIVLSKKSETNLTELLCDIDKQKRLLRIRGFAAAQAAHVNIGARLCGNGLLINDHEIECHNVRLSTPPAKGWPDLTK